MDEINTSNWMAGIYLFTTHKMLFQLVISMDIRALTFSLMPDLYIFTRQTCGFRWRFLTGYWECGQDT